MSTNSNAEPPVSRWLRKRPPAPERPHGSQRPELPTNAGEEPAVSRFLRKRPLALFTFCYVIGAAAGNTGHTPYWICLPLAAAFAAWGALRRYAICLFVAALLLGCGLSDMRAIPACPPSDDARITGLVCEAPEVRERYAAIRLTDVTVNGTALHRDLLIYDYSGAAIRLGDAIACTGDTWLSTVAGNPGAFDYRRWLSSRGISLCATISDAPTVLRHGGSDIRFAVQRAREALLRGIDSMFAPEQAALARGMMLGDTSLMPENLYGDYRRAGLAHLLAVSGLHVGCLAQAIYFLLGRLAVRRSVALVCATALVFFYAALVGMPASALRAALLFACLGGARLTGNPYDALTGLSFAALALTIGNPAMASDTGFILSFCAVAGILFLYATIRDSQPIGRKSKVARAVWRALSVSIAAQLGILPALCCLLGQLQPYAALVSLIAIPLATLLLPLLLIAVPMALALPAAAHAFAYVPGLLLDLLTAIARFAARLHGADLLAPAWPIWLIAIYAVLLFCASRYARRMPIGRAVLIPALIAVCAACYPLAHSAIPDGLAVTFYDAGQGDAALVSAQGKAFAVDLGTPGMPPIHDALRIAGRPIDGVFLTHANSDHTGGLADLVAIRDVPVVYLPEGWVCDDEATNAALAQAGRIELLRAGDVVALSPDVRCEVFAPGPDADSANETSLVLRISYGDASALITGDAPAKSLPPREMDCTVLKVAHHGAKDGLTPYALRIAAPSCAVISVGRNAYGHPAKDTLDLLERAEVPIYRTDRDGAITANLRADGSVEMETFR